MSKSKAQLQHEINDLYRITGELRDKLRVVDSAGDLTRATARDAKNMVEALARHFDLGLQEAPPQPPHWKTFPLGVNLQAVQPLGVGQLRLGQPSKRRKKK